MLLRITRRLAGAASTPDEWTIQPFNYRPVIEGAQGHPGGETTALVFNDTNGDLVADSPYDVTLSQQWNATVAPGRKRGAREFDAVRRGGSKSPRRLTIPRARAVTSQSTSTFAPTTAIPDGDALTVPTPSLNQQHGSACDPGRTGTDPLYARRAASRAGTASRTRPATAAEAHATAEVSINVATYTLSVTKTGNGGITSTPSGIDCGKTCSADFVNGSTVTLAAHPDPGWTLGGWSGACTGTGSCTVSMDAAKSVNADFLPPPPTPGSTANLSLASGTVFFKVPSSEDAVHLAGAAQVPIGTEVDTTDGVAKVTVARGPTLDTSEFYEGDFTVLQPGPKALGELRLKGGNFLDCVSSFRALAKKRPLRRLWGSGKGHFKTRGRYSSATVRGTKWLTEDLCDSTRITVVQGVVLVHDFVRNVDVSVPAGHSYRANALPRERP